MYRESLFGAPSAASSFVRYLFDGQLFNVPNNLRQFSYLLTYLKHEQIFDESYVVRMRTHQIRPTLKRKRFTGSLEPKSLRQCRNDEERCRAMFSLARRDDRAIHDDATIPFNPSTIQQPVDQTDVRQLMATIELNGGPTEWLDLKLALRLPSIVIYMKLQGSLTIVPNADHTININLKTLQVLQGPKTIGERLVMLLASARKIFFGDTVPDFKRLSILDEGGAYDDDDDDDNEDDDNENLDENQRNNDSRGGGGGNVAANVEKAIVRSRETNDWPDYVNDDTFEDDTDAVAARQQELDRKTREQQRLAFGNGSVAEVLFVSNVRDPQISL